MPHLNHKGPEGTGQDSGRKLGICKTSKPDQNIKTEPGKGLGKRRHSGGGEGQGKRLKYNNTINT